MDEQLRRRRGPLSPSPSLKNLEINPLELSTRDHSPPDKKKKHDNDEKNYNTFMNKANSTTKHISILKSSSLLKDHRRTNNNRIGKNVRKLVLINYPLTIILLILLPLASDIIIISADAEPTPVRISSSYAKAPRYSDNHNYNTNTSSTTSTTTIRSTSSKSVNNNDNSNQNNNATRTISSKNYSNQQQVTSIARPFYTKITSDDAVAKPTNFINSFRVSSTTTTKKPKRSYAHSKPSKFFDPSFSTSTSTEKSFPTTSNYSSSSISSTSSFLSSDSGPKIRLEPFFNLLTNFQSLALGTSKEQKFSPSYQTITQSINEHTKKSRGKATKGMREKKRNRNRNNYKGHGPIPIPIPKPLIDPEDLASQSKTTYVHPLDVLNVHMSGGGSSNSKEVEALPTAESLKSLESITKPNHWPYKTTQRSGDRNKHVGFDKTNQTAGKSVGPESRERRLRSDFFENFHDKDVELQADESIMEPHDARDDEGGRYSDPDDQIRSPPSQSSSAGSRNVNIPQGYTQQSDIQAAPGSAPGQGQPPFYSTIYSAGNNNKEDIEMISKYPVSFSYNPANPNNNPNSNQHQNNPPPPQRMQPQYYPIPYPKSKLRPNLHSYYDPHYHKYAGFGEHNGPYGPHYSSGYGNHPPGFNSNYGSHYVGHTLSQSAPPSSSKPLPLGHRPDQVKHQSYNNNNNIPATAPTASSSSGGSESQTGTTSNLSQQGTSSDNSYDFETDNSIGASSNQKIGVMSSFDLFYKEYKLLTWAAFFVVTSLAFLCIIAFLYVNSPPTEVVLARSAYGIESFLDNQQIMKFLSSLVENNSGKTGKTQRKRFKTEMSQKRDPGSIAGQLLGAINKKDL